MRKPEVPVVSSLKHPKNTQNRELVITISSRLGEPRDQEVQDLQKRIEKRMSGERQQPPNVSELEKRVSGELQQPPLVLESTLTMQKLVQTKDHTERLKTVRVLLEAETKRLNTKMDTKMELRRGMLSGQSATASETSFPVEEKSAEDNT